MNTKKEIQKVNFARAFEEDNGFEFKGKRIDSDEKSRQKITGVYNYALRHPEFTTEWVCGDSSTLSLNAEEIIEMYDTMIETGQDIFGKFRIIKDAIK